MKTFFSFLIIVSFSYANESIYTINPIKSDEFTIDKFDKLMSDNSYEYPISKHRFFLLISTIIKMNLVRTEDSPIITNDKFSQGQRIAKEFVDSIYENLVRINIIVDN